MGGCSIDAHGTALTGETIAACRSADAILLGAVGGPSWDSTDPHAPRPEQGLLGLRRELELFANLRPVRPFPSLLDASPLSARSSSDGHAAGARADGRHLLRRQARASPGWATDECRYTVEEVERIARLAFGARARTRVTSVDKANVLETGRLWREVVGRVHAGIPGRRLEHQLVDSAAMKLLVRARHFDVIVTENLFGDILSDEAAMLTGSLGMLPSASLGDGGPGLFEPAHGSAPDIAGRGIANPLATILSAALLLRHGLEMEDEAGAIEAAVEVALERGLRTADLGGSADTAEATRAVLAGL